MLKFLGVNQQYYSKYENGEYEIPSRHIITLSKFYNVASDYILGLIDFELQIGGDLYKRELEIIDKNDIMSRFDKLNHKQKVKVAEYIRLIEKENN